MTYRGHVSRAEAGLRPPRSRSFNIVPSRGGVTGHHAGRAQGVSLSLSDHDRCYDLVRGYQRYHMDTLGWVDLAYTALPCQHGFLFAGRGSGVRTAANGTTAGNNFWYALCGILGGYERPSADMQDAFWAGVRMLRRQGGAGDRTNEHSDHKSTACPGNMGPFIDEGMPTGGDIVSWIDKWPGWSREWAREALARGIITKGTDPNRKLGEMSTVEWLVLSDRMDKD